MKRYIFVLVIIFICISAWFTISYFANNNHIGMAHIGRPDSTLFFRLNEQSILQGNIIKTDYFQAFPYKINLEYPPLPRSILYHFSLFMHILVPSISQQNAIGFLPPLAGLLTSLALVCFIFYISKNKSLTLFVALWSFPGFFSSITHPYLMIDHHYLVNMFIWLWIIFASLTIREPSNNFFRISGALTSICILFTWTGSPLVIGITFFLGFIYWLTNRNFGKIYMDYLSDTWFISGTFLLLYLFSCNSIFGYNIGHFGWVHAITPIAFACIARLLSHFRKNKIIIIILSLVFLIPLASKISVIKDGMSVMTNQTFLFKTVGELRPLYSIIFNKENKNITLSNLLKYFGPLIFLFTFAYIWAPNDILSGKGALFRDMFLIFFILALNQVRYSRWLASATGILSGITTYQLFRLIYEKYHKESYFVLKSLLTFLPIIIVGLNTNFTALSASVSIDKKYVKAFNWIRKHTPDPGGYTNGEKPTYGILSFWDKGNDIAYYSQRPACVSNTMLGLKTMADVFTSKNENEALKLCNKYKIKYLLLERGWLNDNYIDYLDEVKKKFVGPNFLFLSNEWQKKETKANTQNTLYHWLSYLSGIKPTGQYTTTSHFRLRWASPEKKLASPRLTIFEVVKGCKVTGIYKPNQSIAVNLTVTANKLSFVYKLSTKCDNNGKFSLLACYPTENKSGGISTDKTYSITTENKQIGSFKISTEDIENGNTISVRLKNK